MGFVSPPYLYRVQIISYICCIGYLRTICQYLAVTRVHPLLRVQRRSVGTTYVDPFLPWAFALSWGKRFPHAEQNGGTKYNRTKRPSAIRGPSRGMRGESRLKVLHIYKDLYPPTCGGIEVAIQRIIEGTRDACESISVLICSRGRRTQFVEVEGTPVCKVGEWGRFLSAPVAPLYPYWLKKLDTDILHYHIPNPTAVLSHLLVRPQGRVVVHYHSDIVRQKNWLLVYDIFRRRFLRQSQRIIVTSPNYLRTSEALAPLRDRCTVVPFGIPLAKFVHTPEIAAAAQVIRKRYGEQLVLFVGIQRYYKGLHYLVQAMEHVPGKLLVVGNGPLQPELMDFVQRQPYAEKIVFVGQVESVVPYYYAADVFCLPSIYRSEAFGLVLAEAGACGLPLVSTELGTGTSYVNQHDQTGLVVPPMDSAALANALTTILQDPLRRQRYAQAAQDWVREQFGQDRMCQSILQIYQQVMSG